MENKAVQAFQRDRISIINFIEEHQEVFDRFFELADQYNGALTAAKQSIRDIEPAGPVQMGPFRRANASVSTTYNPGFLPNSVLILPGVVKSVDPKVIEKLVLDGVILPASLLAAKSVETGTAKIDGPKEIVVKL